MVILVDSKGAPTATDRELRRRRRPHKDRKKAQSPRHRGRKHRGRYDPLPRRKKGDKSKNAKFAPEKHAFEVARREADKRGFTVDSGKIVQFVTDGDNDLERYAKLLFPEATYHTLDVVHVVEHIWEAGCCFLREGSAKLRKWVEDQKELLYAGRSKELLSELRRCREILGRGKKKARSKERFGEIIKYLAKRKEMMCYAELVDEDLEVGSGAVEGAVKHVIGKRCDQGGMRWIRERAEAVVQLRCIELNGDWDTFVEFVHDRVRQRGLEQRARVRIQRKEPAPLPQIQEEA